MRNLWPLAASLIVLAAYWLAIFFLRRAGFSPVSSTTVAAVLGFTICVLVFLVTRRLAKRPRT